MKRLSQSFYVDNCVTSLPDEEMVSRFITESVAIMAEGQFELRGWERRRNAEVSGTEEICPVLGMNWHPVRDVLTVNLKFLREDTDLENMIVTKRRILSIAQKVFDPIGYLCPALLVPKLMLQKLWEKSLAWDEPLDEVISEEFKIWLKDLPYLEKIELSRWVHMNGETLQNLSIHIFCDASKLAYACAFFLRVSYSGKVFVSLLASRARLAPIKKSTSKMTIPRLELLAATIGARLYVQVAENLPGNIESFFWSDSSTVISWIQRQEEWEVFVWNRVKEIRSLTSMESWRHLPGAVNPADLQSRGCTSRHLFQSRWWEGPKWLYESRDKWPSSAATNDEEEVNAERRRTLVTSLVNVYNSCDWHFSYFSQYSKMVRMVAWIQRFVKNCRKGDQKYKGELTSEEFEAAEKFILTKVQQESFSGVDDKRIIHLDPFYEEGGLIRLRSRVCNREDTQFYRFPVVLPSKHEVTIKLIRHYHLKSCHVGIQDTLSLLLEKFWILSGRRSVRSVISKCVLCRRYTGKHLAVHTPPLSANRVREAVAFEVTGIDFAGPLFLKTGEKVWICMFTCAIFRAVHLELCCSLSTSNFLQALRRFVSRRGRPKTIYSDNGTSFVGAENALSCLDWDVITREMSVQRIRWHFNPPTAAWWGGFWKRLIGVMKQLLRKTLGRASLDYETLLTLLCECEAIINSRPLTNLSEDPQELVALTPAMFLRDQVDCGLPDCDAIDNASLCRKVRRVQTLREEHRKRFRLEYLGQLKLVCANKTHRQIALNEIVLVGNDGSKRLDWPMGRVVELFPGKDGSVRLCKVKTAKGYLLRPVQRLYPLECCTVPEFELQNDVKTSMKDDSELNGTPHVPELAARDSSSEDEYCESAGVFKVSIPTNSAKVFEVKITRTGRASKMPKRYLE
ncbi:uncharacterized protein [Diabrotica undecimpunctata]|uniref:uncharacterized protein n=1 Tax=Diabrotica undecimpunctata TaxID=50387 RepID=UPI003B640E32